MRSAALVAALALRRRAAPTPARAASAVVADQLRNGADEPRARRRRQTSSSSVEQPRRRADRRQQNARRDHRQTARRADSRRRRSSARSRTERRSNARSPRCSCTFKGHLNPYEQLAVCDQGQGRTSRAGTVDAAARPKRPSKAAARRRARGRCRPDQRRSRRRSASTAIELTPFNEDGTPATQAGAHPFQLTTTLGAQPDAPERAIRSQLPEGSALPPPARAWSATRPPSTQCTMANFFALVLETNLCPPDTVVGVATVTRARTARANVITKTVPVFNLVPAQGSRRASASR